MASIALLVNVSPGFGRSELEACSAAALDAGFSGIEQFVCADVANDLSGQHTGHPDRSADRLREAPVSALARVLTPVDIDDASRVVRCMLDRAANANATCLNLTLPPLAAFSNRPGESGFAGYQDSLNYAYHLLRNLRHDAESSGVVITVTGASGGCLVSPVELRELIDAVNSWAVGVCVDTRRVNHVGDPADWIVTLGTRVRAVRVWLDELRPQLGGAAPACGSWVDRLGTALKKIHFDRLIIAAGERPPSELHAALDALLSA